MNHVLAINTSLSGENSQSLDLVNQFLEDLSARKQVSVQRRDLATDNIPHLSGEEMQAWMTEPQQRTEKQHDLASLSDGYVEELSNADTIVIGLPMYNFGIPSVLKTWIDRIARAGVTFRYTENGPVGLLTDKKVYVLATRGGIYQGTPLDTQTDYLKNVLAFVGIQNVEFVYAEGLAMGEDKAAEAKIAAKQKIVELIDKHAA